MRGPQHYNPLTGEVVGITPACAGTTNASWPVTSNDGDHPRMCGDHIFSSAAQKAASGSPPHVRGPQLVGIFTLYSPGITPACAGTTNCSPATQQRCWDHPRMCGDHDRSAGYRYQLLGSPPHVRGPLFDSWERNLSLGITPACAGTTTSY